MKHVNSLPLLCCLPSLVFRDIWSVWVQQSGPEHLRGEDLLPGKLLNTSPPQMYSPSLFPAQASGGICPSPWAHLSLAGDDQVEQNFLPPLNSLSLADSFQMMFVCLVTVKRAHSRLIKPSPHSPQPCQMAERKTRMHVSDSGLVGGKMVLKQCWVLDGWSQTAPSFNILGT